jgi:hypothetical protein
VCSYFDTTEGYLRFVSTVGQMTVPFFSGRNFFWWFEKHSRPDDCTFFPVVIFSGHNWLTQRHNWYGKIGKEVTPKTISRHNQKTDLCNQKLFPAGTKKTQRHNWYGR